VRCEQIVNKAADVGAFDAAGMGGVDQRVRAVVQGAKNGLNSGVCCCFGIFNILLSIPSSLPDLLVSEISGEAQQNPPAGGRGHEADEDSRGGASRRARACVEVRTGVSPRGLSLLRAITARTQEESSKTKVSLSEAEIQII